MKKSTILVLILISGLSFSVKSQSNNQYIGWMLWLHSQKISTKSSVNLDFQIRTSNHFEGIKTTLIRPSFNYKIADNLSTAIGYTYLNTKSINANNQTIFLTENMIWEQLLTNFKVNKINFVGRLRIEHRFIEQQTSTIFSQRIRLFLRSQIPLAKQKTTNFSKGTYFVSQEEVFFNLQNKDMLNTHFYDQNRIFGGFGYRFSPKMDLEAGYLNQSVKGKTTNSNNNIFQVVLFTRLKNK